MEELLISKLNPAGQETWRYSGRVLQRAAAGVLVEAFFDRADIPFHGILLRTGDRFVEAYFSDRWYNIFEIHDRDSGQLKGWYCNVTAPARILDGRVEYIDLALDLLVYPDGRTLLLDEDEFAALAIDARQRSQARAAADQLEAVFAARPDMRLEQAFGDLAGK